MTERYYPLFVRLEGMRVVVVGGGNVATRKVEHLLTVGADVTVISPALTPQLVEWIARREVIHCNRLYTDGDIDGFNLAFAATDRPDVNQRVATDGKTYGCWVNVCDGTEGSTFIVPSVVRRGRLTVAFSTDGSSPAVAKMVKEQLMEMFGDEYEPFLEKLAAVREQLKQNHVPQLIRAEVFRRIARSDALRFMGEGRDQEADALIERIIGEETVDG